jgi:hypothetical protein
MYKKLENWPTPKFYPTYECKRWITKASRAYSSDPLPGYFFILVFIFYRALFRETEYNYDSLLIYLYAYNNLTKLKIACNRKNLRLNVQSEIASSNRGNCLFLSSAMTYVFWLL